MTGLTKRSHVAPKMQHVTFCDSIVRFNWCRTKRIDSVCGVTWIPLCARDGTLIIWGRGEEKTLSYHVVSTQCAEGLRNSITIYFAKLLRCFVTSIELLKFRQRIKFRSIRFVLLTQLVADDRISITSKSFLHISIFLTCSSFVHMLDKGVLHLPTVAISTIVNRQKKSLEAGELYAETPFLWKISLLENWTDFKIFIYILNIW